MQTTTDLSNRLPNDVETSMAHDAFLKLASLSTRQQNVTFVADGDSPVSIEVPASVAQLITELLRHIGKGHAVTFVPFGAELTTQQAADMLNVSRPFLIGLLETGTIAYHKVGTHRRVRASDVIAYRNKRSEEQQAALTELAQLGQEYDSE